MKKPYLNVKAICIVVFMLLLQTSFAQEVDTQQQTNTDATTVTDESSSDAVTEQAQSDVLTRAAESEGISSTHWDAITPTSPGSIFKTDKSHHVDMSTGKVNVRVPIATVGTRDIQIPIELSYTTGGIKLRDVASWVGLGWNLSTGGKITRILNKFPDKYDGSMDGLLDSTTWTYSKPAMNGAPAVVGNFGDRLKDTDTQPDLYHFEIPGKSGMFVLDSRGNAATIPYQNIKINFDKTTQFFEIIDDLGNRYFFQDTETTEVRTPEVDIRPNIGPYESTWYLTSILNIKGEVVDFEYKRLYTGSTPKHYLNTTYTKSIIIGLGGRGNDIESPHPVIYTNLVDPLYLTKISWRDGSVEFMSSSNRPDIPDQQAFQLDAIKLYAGENGDKLVKTYSFTYTAFANKALKLDKINVSTPKSTGPEFFRKFEYFTDQNLPALTPQDGKNAHYYELDHWGYYNGVTDNSVGIPKFIISDNAGLAVERPSYDIRTPSLAHTRANSLKKVWVTSSGYDEFEYELNTCKFKFSDTSVETIGGLRIKSITTRSHELSHVSQKVRYDYADDIKPSSGVAFNDIAYYHSAAYIAMTNTSYYIVKDSPLRPLFDLDGSHIRYGKVKELFDNGSSNTYRYTTKEDYSDGGYTLIYNMITPSEIITNKILAEANYDFGPTTTQFWKRGLLTEKISHDASRRETYKETCEYNLNAPIKKTIKGLFPFTSRTRDFGIVTATNPYLAYYKYISQPIYMTKKTVSGIDIPKITTDYEYDDKDTDSSDLDHILLKKKTETSDGVAYTTTYKYPFDYKYIAELESGNAIKFMKDNNISSVPIEVVNYKNDEIIGGELSIYDNWHYMHDGSIMGAMFNLREVKELLLKKPKLKSEFAPSSHMPVQYGSGFVFDKSYVTKAAYEYNYSNKLGCIKERNKPSLSFIYDDSRTLPIAQTTNAEAQKIGGTYYQEALHTSFEYYDGREHPRAKTGSKILNGRYYIQTKDFVPGVYVVSYWISNNDGVDWELNEHEMEVTRGQDRAYSIGGNGITDELRVHKKDALMQTKTYDLSKNVTSETDANGKTTYYEYDALGRLITVKDNNRDKIKSYTYYIKN